MKFNQTVVIKLLILLCFFCISCAGYSKTTIHEIVLETFSEEPFESVHNNKKYIENIKEALVTSEAVINGKQFKITYYLAKVVLINEQGYQIPFLLENLTDNISTSDVFIWHPTDNDSGVLLSLDDFTLNSWLHYFDVFDKYGAKVTFFVQGRPELRGDNVVSLAEFCNNALKRGHDIGFHTLSHANLTKVPHDVFISETIAGAQIFSKAGIPLSAFAYPFGLSLPWMNETLSPVFRVLRGFDRDTHFYDMQTVNNGYIISKTIDNTIYPNNEEFESEMRLLLLIAKFTGNVIIPLTSHEISDAAQWGIKPSRLEFLLGTIQHLKLKFYTYRDILKS